LDRTALESDGAEFEPEMAPRAREREREREREKRGSSTLIAWTRVADLRQQAKTKEFLH
jgi:hypothetical protein